MPHIAGSVGHQRANASGAVQYLQYPDNIGTEVQNWINFSAFDFKSGGNPTIDIALYIPSDGLQTSYKSEWEQVGLGRALGIATQAEKLVSTQAEGFNLEKFKTRVGAGLAGSADTAAKAAMLEVAKRSEGIVAGAKTWMERKAGAVLNPYIVAAYKGPSDMRTHDFTFQMLPQSISESKNCVKIANAFKKCMLPSHSGGDSASATSMLFGYPDEFEIRYTINGRPLPETDKNPMFNIGRSVLTSCDLDFATENVPLFFDDTQYPVSISMKLSFMETEILHREKVDDKGV